MRSSRRWKRSCAICGRTNSVGWTVSHAHGRIKGGQHLKYPQDSRFADLLVTLFDRNSIPVEKLGDSGGILSEV